MANIQPNNGNKAPLEATYSNAYSPIYDTAYNISFVFYDEEDEIEEESDISSDFYFYH